MFPVTVTSIITMRITELVIIASLEKYSGTSFSLTFLDKFALVFMLAVRKVWFFLVANFALPSRLNQSGLS